MRTLATDGTADQLLDYWRANGSGKQPAFRPASWRWSGRLVTLRGVGRFERWAVLGASKRRGAQRRRGAPHRDPAGTRSGSCRGIVGGTPDVPLRPDQETTVKMGKEVLL